MVKDFITFAYHPPLPLDGHGNMSMLGLTIDDYISKGLDFPIAKKNDAYTKVHEFFLGVASKGKDYSRWVRK